MRRAALAFVVACFGAVIACGDDALQAAGFGSDDGAHDAGVADASIAPNVDASPEVVTGGGGSSGSGSGGVDTGDNDAAIVDASVDADAAIDAAPTVDAGPCEASSFDELWNLSADGGTWIPGTNWTVTGPAPNVSYFPLHGGYFATNRVSELSRPLLPACRYGILLPIKPPSPLPADLTFLRVTNTDPSATVTFAFTSSTDDAGTLHAFISVRLGGGELLKAEISPTDVSGVGLTYTKKGSFLIGIGSNGQDGEFFPGPDASFGGFQNVELGVVDGPSTSAASIYFGSITVHWNDTL